MKSKNTISLMIALFMVMLFSIVVVTASPLNSPTADFGNVELGASQSITISITNSNLTSNATINNIVFTNLTKGSVNIDNNSISVSTGLPLVIEANSSEDIDFSFSAPNSLDDLGSFSGTYTIEYDVNGTSKTETGTTTVYMTTESFDFSLDEITFDPDTVYSEESNTYNTKASYTGTISLTAIRLCMEDSLHIDFGNGDVVTKDLSSGSNKVSYAYPQPGTYNFTSSINFPAYCKDTDSSNNVKQIFNHKVLPKPIYDLILPSEIVFDMYRGEERTINVSEFNNGSVDINITNSIENLTITTVSPSNIVISAGNTEDAQVTTQVSSSATALTSLSGVLNASYETHNGTLIVEKTNVVVNILNHRPTAHSTIYQLVSGKDYSGKIVLEDDDSMDVSNLKFKVVSDSLGTNLELNRDYDSNKTFTGTAPVVSSNKTYSVVVDVTDGIETVRRTINFLVRPNVPDISITEVTFSGNRDSTYTEDVTITNTGVQNLTSIDLRLYGVPSKYSASISPESISFLGVGESTTARVTLTIPENQDSGLEDVGDIKVSAEGTTGNTQDQSNVYVDAPSNLEITNVEVEVTGEDHQHDSSTDVNDSFDVYSSDTLSITLTLKNNYTSSNDPDIEDVFFTVDADNNDFNIDSIDSNELNRIEASEDEDLTLSFEIQPDDSIQDGDYTTLTIIAQGEDEEGRFTHKDSFTLRLEYQKVNDLLEITGWSISPSTITCDDDSFVLNVDIKNNGVDEQDHVFVQLNSALSAFRLYSVNSPEINNVEENDRHTFSFTIPMNDYLTEGYHTIKAYLYYGSSSQYHRLSDYEEFWIKVDGPNCYVGSNSSNVNTEDNDEEVNDEVSENTQTVVRNPFTSGALVKIGPMIDGWTTKVGFYISDGVKIALLALLAVVVLGGLTLGIVALAKRLLMS